MDSIETISVADRALELSGCAVVDGGLLVVEDEVIGSVLFFDGIDSKLVSPIPVKLERKKKDRAPYADAFKLFPVQDFEDIATDRNEQVFLVGSHQGKGGERRPDREFLVEATWDKKSEELKVRREQYRLLELIAPVLETLGCPIGLNRTDVTDTLNIEGLALHAGQLFIGLRAPLTPEGEAIVLFADASKIVDGGNQVDWRTIRLDLEGGGVRALDWDPVKETMLVVAGSTKDGAPASALWHCDADGGALTRAMKFGPEIANKVPEGVCRLAERDGGGLAIALDGDGKGSGGELLKFPW